MDEKTVDFLTKNGLSCLDDKFKEQLIDYDVLITLEKDDVERIVPQMGLQKKLLAALAEISSSERQEGDNDREQFFSQIEFVSDASQNEALHDVTSDPLQLDPDSQLHSSGTKRGECEGGSEDGPAKKMCTVLHSGVKNSVRAYLDRSFKGRMYLGLYNNNLFTSIVRSDLAEYIVNCEFDRDRDASKTIPPKRMLQLRDEIVAVFPSEVASVYYVPRKSKTKNDTAKQPKGKLYDKYTAMMKNLRIAGLRQKGPDSQVSKDDSEVICD